MQQLGIPNSCSHTVQPLHIKILVSLTTDDKAFKQFIITPLGQELLVYESTMRVCVFVLENLSPTGNTLKALSIFLKRTIFNFVSQSYTNYIAKCF